MYTIIIEPDISGNSETLFSMPNDYSLHLVGTILHFTNLQTNVTGNFNIGLTPGERTLIVVLSRTPVSSAKLYVITESSFTVTTPDASFYPASANGKYRYVQAENFKSLAIYERHLTVQELNKIGKYVKPYTLLPVTATDGVSTYGVDTIFTKAGNVVAGLDTDVADTYDVEYKVGYNSVHHIMQTDPSVTISATPLVIKLSPHFYYKPDDQSYYEHLPNAIGYKKHVLKRADEDASRTYNYMPFLEVYDYTNGEVSDTTTVDVLGDMFALHDDIISHVDTYTDLSVLVNDKHGEVIANNWGATDNTDGFFNESFITKQLVPSTPYYCYKIDFPKAGLTIAPASHVTDGITPTPNSSSLVPVTAGTHYQLHNFNNSIKQIQEITFET